MTLVMCHAFSMAGFPIRTRADHFSFADPRTFSQLTASFFALGSPGILRMHFIAFLADFALVEIVVRITLSYSNLSIII